MSEQTHRGGRIESALINYYMPPAPVAEVISRQQLIDVLRELPVMTFGHQAATLMNQIRQHHADLVLSNRDYAILSFVDDTVNNLLSSTDLDYKIESLIRFHTPFVAIAAIESGPAAITKHDANVQLLDLLLRQYVGWSEDLGILGDEFLARTEGRMHSLANGKMNTEECLRQLQSDLSKHDRAFSKLEQRLIQAQRTRLQRREAETHAAAILNREMARQKLPIFIIFLLQGAWYEFLKDIIIQHGIEGVEWKKATILTKALIWSLKPRKNRDKHIKIMDNLPDRLLTFSRKTNTDSALMEDMLLDIRSEYKLILDGNPSEAFDFKILSPATHTSFATPSSDKAADKTIAALDVGKWFLYHDRNEPEDRIARLKLILNSQHAQSLLFTNHNRHKDLELGYGQMTTYLANGTIKPLSIASTASTIIKKHFHQILHKLSEQASKEKMATETTQREELVLLHQKARQLLHDKALAKQKDIAKLKRQRSTALRRKSLQKMRSAQASVAGLRVEAWVKLPLIAGTLTPCKLVAIMPGEDKYIFANRAGVKVADYTARQLSNLLVSENSEILETGDEFEQVLSNIIMEQRHNRTLGVSELTGEDT